VSDRVRFTVAENEADVRLDVLIARHVPALSRAQAQRLIRDGHITISSGRAKPAMPVRAGAAVEVVVPAATPSVPAPEALPLDILYDDADVVVVNKPAGLVVHPGAGHARGTLVNALLHHVSGLSGIGGQERPGIVHRLDRGTSGVMVVAKHDRAHRDLARQFHDREVKKEYLALVWGAPAPGQAMERPIGRDPKVRQKMSSRARRSRTATTTVIDVERLGSVALVRLQIMTGRTHQIRVHLSEEGHPVVGDVLYGGARKPLPPALKALAGLDRPFLHAVRLSFTHPGTGAAMSFAAPLPADLARALDAIRSARG
jgi:23S rRNA pseudouridine1911/1915/1917 synthase